MSKSIALQVDILYYLFYTMLLNNFQNCYHREYIMYKTVDGRFQGCGMR